MPCPCGGGVGQARDHAVLKSPPWAWINASTCPLATKRPGGENQPSIARLYFIEQVGGPQHADALLQAQPR